MFCSLAGHAQNGFTMRLGPTVLTNTWDGITQAGYFNNGWHIGAALRLGDDRFFMNPGLLYQSITVSSQKNFSPFLRKPRFTVLGFSMLGAYRLVKTHAFSMRLHAGAAANYITAIDEKNTLGLDLDSLETLHFQGVGVLGMDFYWLSLDLRYSYGLTNMFKNQDSKGNYLMLSLGFFI